MHKHPHNQPQIQITAETEETLRHLELELSNVAVTWGQWQLLFAPPNEHGPSLTASAPTFFVIVRECMMNDLLSGFMRLLDPAVSAGKDTCSFARLHALLPDSSCRTKFGSALDQLKQKTQTLKDWRNKRLSHNDYLAMMHNQPIPDIQLDEIKQAIDSASDLLNLVNQDLGLLSTLHRQVFVPGGASCLMTFLDKGLDTIHGEGNRPPLKM